jgi:cytochrome P450
MLLVSIRRKALKPFHFTDGTRVEAGEWICAPLAGMNLDPKNHARPDEFHGFRFVHPDTMEKFLAERPPHKFEILEGQTPSKFTDISDVPFWGTGKMTWLVSFLTQISTPRRLTSPSSGGRLYASSVIKTMLGLLLTKWDMQLAEPNSKQHFAWRSWIYPYASTKGVVRPIRQ